MTKLQRYVRSQLWDSHIKAGSLIRDLGKLDYKNGSQSVVPEVPWGEEGVLAQLSVPQHHALEGLGSSGSVCFLKSEVRWGVGFFLSLAEAGLLSSSGSGGRAMLLASCGFWCREVLQDVYCRLVGNYILTFKIMFLVSFCFWLWLCSMFMCVTNWGFKNNCPVSLYRFERREWRGQEDSGMEYYDGYQGWRLGQNTLFFFLKSLKAQ